MSEVIVGTPSAVLLPAREHRFKYETGPAILEVPVRAAATDKQSSNGYDVCPEEGVFLFGDLLRALFERGAYPNLADGQMFVISGVAIEGDSIKVAGRVITALPPAEDKTEVSPVVEEL